MDSYLETITDRNNKERLQIAKGAIYRYLQTQNKPVCCVEIAMNLGLNVSVVRQELNRLIDQRLIVVRDAPMQSNLSSAGLVYLDIRKL